MPISDSFLQELRVKNDINDIISGYVSLKKRGSTYIGLCPFHNEKTPSFTVYPDTQSFYCFGCGAGGDAVTFIRRIENLDYLDAVKLLAQRAGLQMPDDGYDDSLSKKRKTVFEINRAAARFYHSYMMSSEGQKGLNYFLNRGLTKKTITKFGLGYAPDTWDSLLRHLKDKGFSVSDMAIAGVIKKGNKGYYDIFRNRVMTPIIDVRGNVIAFGGRVLDDSKPKYINSSDTLVYKKTNELFALNFAKDSGQESLILCEGYMDAIAMHQAGFNNAVAGCGTALTPEQVRLISRYSKEVLLAYDSDEAGQKALTKAVSLFNQTDVRVKIPSLIGGKDPDEIIKVYGRDKFKGILDSASNEIEYELSKLNKKYNLLSTQGKIDFLKECIAVLAKVSPIEQDIYMSRLSEELGVEKSSIKIQLDEYIRKNKRRNEKKEFSQIIDNSIRNLRKESADADISLRNLKAQERMLGILALYPDCSKLCGRIDAEKLASGFIRTVYSLILEKIENGMEVDLVYFGQYLSPEEAGKLSGIINNTKNSADPKKEFLDCVEVVEEEFLKSKKSNLEEISNDDFRNLFNIKNHT